MGARAVATGCVLGGAPHRQPLRWKSQAKIPATAVSRLVSSSGVPPRHADLMSAGISPQMD